MKTEEISTATDINLISRYVWGMGIESDDFTLIKVEMDKRGINHEKLVNEIENLMYQAELRAL